MNKKLKRIVASAVALCIVNGYLADGFVAYAETTSTKSIDVKKAISVSDGEKKRLTDYINSAESKNLNMLYKADEEVTIIVELESKSLLEHYLDDNSEDQISDYISSTKAKRITNNLLKEQQNITNKILKEVSSDVEVEDEYTVALNGFAIKAKFKDLDEIKNIKGVKNAFISTTYELPKQPEIQNEVKMSNSNGTIGSTEANNSGYTGSNTVVAVIDTGIDLNHEAFNTIPEEVKYSEEDINSIISNNSMNARGNLYKNGKVIFAYDYADGDDNPADKVQHGTHVAGTVAGNSDVMKGVAPDAQLAIMKVFSDNSGGATDVNILAALNDAVSLGVDAINMSLGSASGFSAEASEVYNETYDRVYEAGISLICAAGNDTSSTVNSSKGDLPLVKNPDNGIVGSPSTYNAATSIASINNTKTHLPYFLLGESKIVYTDSNDGTSMAFTSLESDAVEYAVVPGVGSISDFEEVDVEGKIALVKRGTIAFTEKEYNAKLYGAIGVIIYDNVEGALINMQGSGSLPMIFISKKDGEALVNEVSKNVSINRSYIGEFEGSTSGLMSDFSSWGVTPEMKLKPEITAPGGGIYSTLPGGGYGSMNGTSMASPHVAGAAALLREYLNEKYNNELTTKQEDDLLTNLLMSTAKIAIDEHGVSYSPRKQGAGVINVNDAIKTGAYLTNACGKPKAELGDNQNGEFKFSFDVVNISNETLNYTVDTTVLTEKIVESNGESFFAQASRELDDTEVEVNIEGVSGNSITVNAGETKTVSVSLSLTEKAKEAFKVCVNGTFIDGFVTLTSNNEDKIDLGLPFLGFYGDWESAKLLDSNMYDGEDPLLYDTALAYFDLQYGTGYYLGSNLFVKKGEESIIDEDKIAIGNAINGVTVVSPMVGLLRSAKDITYSVTNEDNEVVYEKVTGQQRKSYYHASAGFVTYAMDETGWDAIDWENSAVMPEGNYTYKINATGMDGREESLEFPITIDKQKPELVRTENITVDGKDYLKVVITDNHYIQGAQVVDIDDNPITEVIVLDSNERGDEYEILLDLEGMEDVVAAKVVAIDYAQNMLKSKEFGLTPDGILPQRVSLSSKDITTLEGSAFQMSAIVYPESAENKSLTWSSSNPEVATVDENGAVKALSAGETTITATTFNGKSDSTIFTVVKPEVTELKEPFIIENDGKYKLPANITNKTITIKESANNVTINGDTANNKENPYKGIDIVVEGDTNLTINGLNIERNNDKKNVIDFVGTNNTLTIQGENYFTSSVEFSSRAMITVFEGKTVEFNGKGLLDIDPGKSNYGAAIGGSASSKETHNSGKILIKDGNINVKSYGTAAAIGGAGSGIATDIRISGGKVNATQEGAQYLQASAATIGSSATAYNEEGKPGTIRISGGEVIVSNTGSGAAIGDCKGGNTPYNIIISGGKVNAESTSTDDFNSGAAIGGGTSSRGNIRITILGGNVNATSNSSAAAIGGGADNADCSVSIEGGTVTATSTGKGAAIGNGYYGKNAEVRLFKGSVKAIASKTGVEDIGNAESSSGARVVGIDGTIPCKVEIPAVNVNSVKVNGDNWKITSTHENDDKLYLYLVNSSKPYNIEVVSEDIVKTYSVTVINNVVTVTEVDFNAPSSPIITEENGVVTITAAGDDTNVIEYSLDGETWTVYTEPVNVEENTTIYARAIDAKGNISEVVTYTVTDKTAPSTPIVTEENGVVTITAADDDTSVIEYSFDCETWVTYTEPINVEENTTVYVKAIDKEGNTSEVISYTVPDRTAPNKPVINENNGLVTIVAADEDTVRLEYSFDNVTWILYSEEIEINEDITIYARAIDAAGNISETSEYKINKDVFKNALQIAVDIANEVTDKDLENVVPVVVSEFKAALKEAIEVLNNNNATQNQVNSAFDRLVDVMHKLSFYKGDKTQLIALVEKINGLSKDEFIASTWNKLEDVLMIVSTIINDENALEDEVKDGYNKLIKAYLELRLKPNKDKLEELINKAENLDVTKYTEASLKNVNKALEVARFVFANDEATEDEISKAKSDLENAINNLVENNKNNSSSNGSNSGNNTGNNNTVGSNNSNSSNSNNSQGKLPNTGGRAAGAVVALGAMISVAGLVLTKKRK